MQNVCCFFQNEFVNALEYVANDIKIKGPKHLEIDSQVTFGGLYNKVN